MRREPGNEATPSMACLHMSANSPMTWEIVYIYYQELLFVVIKYPWLFSRCIQNADVGVYRKVMGAGGCPLIIAQ